MFVRRCAPGKGLRYTMNSTQLLYFVETVNNNSMRKAAKILQTTQPNVSNSISALEREIGVQLLIRSNRGIELTKEGQRFYTIAVGVTDRMAVLKSMFAKEEHETGTTVLNIATNPSQITTEILAEMNETASYDRFLITVRNLTVPACADSVHSGESEIGIVFITSGYDSQYKNYFKECELEYFTTSVCSCVVNVGRKNPFYDRESITRHEIIRYPLARFVEDELSYLDFSISSDGIGLGDNHKVYYFNSDAQILSFVAQTDAYKVGYSWCGETYERFGIRCLKIVPDDGIPLELGWIKRKGHGLSAAATRFIRTFEERYGDK